MNTTEEIFNEIQESNPHWVSNKIPTTPFKYKRKLYFEIEKKLSSRFILTIQGLRRTGKSVIQKQITEYYCQNYLSKNQLFNGKRLFIFSFDSSNQLELIPEKILKNSLEIYFKRVLKTPPQEVEETILIALDEIQNIDGWQAVIKKYYDFSPNIKFILTGSSSLYLKEGAESLVGRSIDYHLGCLDFEEFLDISNLSKSFGTIKFSQNLNDLRSLPALNLPYEILEAFETFLLVGGFPDTAKLVKDKESILSIQKFIRESVIAKIINLDLKKYFNVQNTHADNSLFKIFASESGNFLEILNLSREVGLSRDTIKSHIEIFEKSNLIKSISKFDRKLRKEIKSSKKYYVSSPSLMYSTLYKNNTEDTSFLGYAAETYAFNKLQSYSDLIYVDRQESNEIDFHLPIEKLFIECKYSSSARNKDFKYLTKRIQETKFSGLILSKDTWYQGNHESIPLMLI